MPAKMNVVLNVEDVDRSAEFYEGLGFRTSRRDYEGYSVREAILDHVVVTLAPKSSPWMDEGIRDWLQNPPGCGVVMNVTVDDLDAAWDRAREAGADVETPLGEQPWGERGFMIDDPDGYVLLFSAATVPADVDEAEGTLETPASPGAGPVE